MNRIYQGRVSNIFNAQEQELDLNLLWEHHALFQDAVNYYVVCLLALAGPKNESLWQIRQRLNAAVTDADGNPQDDDLMVWRPFRRRGALRGGMRDSVAPYLCPGQPDATPEDCFAAVMKGNECAQTEESRVRLSEGLAQLLAKCTGDSGCKQAAPVFLPRFAKPDYKGNYGADTTTLLREDQAARLPFVIHNPQTRADSPELDEFGVHSIALPNEKKPQFAGEEAIKKLKSMVAEWRKRQPESGEDWKRLESAIAKLETSIEIPGYAGASAKGSQELSRDKQLRLFAMFLFKYVERSEFTLGLLRATTPKPDPDEQPPVPVSRQSNGGDPIRIARGSRGYVFRAFTSLPCWGGDDLGKPQWIEFDFAAFEEALKALHQVDAKAEERRKEREKKEAQQNYQRGKTTKWKSTSEESTPPPVLVGDPRIARLEWLLSSDPAAGGLAEEYEMSEGISVEYGLQQRTIRGFRELRKKWVEILAKKNARDYSVALHEELKQKLRDFQKENPTIVGSVRLFEALLEKDNWLIWREPTADEMNQWRKDAGLPKDVQFAPDPLQALTDERELLHDIDRLSGPIRFTPAHPEHSRRQFYFSDVTDLTAKNRLRHDRQTVDVELAVKEDGVWRKKEVRLHFSAPRLLRDQLNNASGKDALFQQAMMEALGISSRLTALKKKQVVEGFEHCAAVALMPELKPTPKQREMLEKLARENPAEIPKQVALIEKNILLNFPVELDALQIPKQLLENTGRKDQFHTRKDPLTKKEIFDSYWERQMVASYKDRKVDTMFHLRWETTSRDVKRPEQGWWWEKDTKFSCLSVDLGQRDAGAFALIEATPGDPPKPQSRRLGEAGDKPWWATVKATGVLHLPGEDAKLRRDRTAFDEEGDDTKELEELSGHRGRMATEAEWTEARDSCERLGLVADKVLGKDCGRYSFPELNDQLLYALYRAQQRLARLQGWSCVAWEETDEKLKAKFEKRRDRIQKQIKEAITHRAEEAAKPENEREQEILDRGRWLDEAKPFVERNAWDCVADCIKREIEKEREIIQAQLVRIADRIQPLRGEWDDERVRELIQRLAAETNFSSPVTRALAAELAALVAANDSAKAVHLLKQHLSRERNEIPADLFRLAQEIRPFLRRRWKWEQRSGGKNHWLVIEKVGVAYYEPVKLAGQRGLSLARIEQLDSLRQRCISLNRTLRQNIGEPAKLGKSKRGIELPDPCPDILDRLDALKEQRVNQTAHLIVAQALGVRLKPHEKDEHERAARDIHGEYERIPGRQPVDFIAIENLEYYNMTQRRERSTNARLMKWCRRQLRNKLIMLCEPYGLRVVEVWPADTSKFCSLTGVAGFRAVELNPDDAENFRWKKHLLRLREADARKRKLDDEDRKESEQIKALFDQLTELNKDLLAERDKARAEGRHFRPKWRTLLAPMPLGPLFVPASATETIARRNKKTGKDEQVVVFKTVNGCRPTVLQADINAAINIGLRAIASPQADDIHTRIRAKSDGKAFAVRADNKREEARWGDSTPPIVVTDAASREKLLTDKWLNFYFDFGEVGDFDHAAIDGIQNRVASGRGLWRSIKGNDKREGKDWQRCLEINAARLRSWGLTPPAGWEDDDVPFAP